MRKSVFLLVMSGFLLIAVSAPLRAAPSQTYNAQLEYLKAINVAGPARDPQLVLLLMTQYISVNQADAGIEFFNTVLEKYRSKMPPEQQSLYLTALGLLRASRAQDVFLLKRPGWVSETIKILEEARKLSGNSAFLPRWAAGNFYAELPGLLGKQEAAYEDLQWCLQNAAKAPNPGWMREVYFHLAVLSKKLGKDEAHAQAFLRQSGYASLDSPHGLTTPFAVNKLTGNTFGVKRIREVLPGKVFVLSGFEFTEYYFVVSDDGKELIAIDAGTRPDSAQNAFEALTKRFPALPPLTTIFFTHAHWDHVGGHQYFRQQNPNMRFYARDNYRQEIARDVNAASLGSRYFFGSRFNIDAVKAFKPDVTISKPTQVTVGGTRFDLIPVSGGETEDAMFIHLPAESVLFVGDFMMPYFGAPSVEEGDIAGLYQSIETAVALKPAHLLHGHEPLTDLFNSTLVLTEMKQHLQWLHQATLGLIRQGASRAAIHHQNLIPPDIFNTPAAQQPYLVMREHFIDRVYDQNVGYWQPGLQGLDQLDTKELGAVFSYYLGLSDRQIADAVEKMLANGDLELAGKTVNEALSQYPQSRALQEVRSRAFWRLKQKFENFDPFKFIEYSGEIGSETPQLQ